MKEIIIAQQFRGPPNSGNGGYVCGLMGALIDGPSTAVLRAPPPLDTLLVLERDGERVRIRSGQGDLIGEARPAGDDPLATPPAPPSYAQAKAAGLRFPGLTRPATSWMKASVCASSSAKPMARRRAMSPDPGAPTPPSSTTRGS